MVGGYQIIDLNDCVKSGTDYIWVPKIKPNYNKPLRLEGLRGKSETLPYLECISEWTSFYESSGGDITYTFEDTNNDVTIAVELSPVDLISDTGIEGSYGVIKITEEE